MERFDSVRDVLKIGFEFTKKKEANWYLTYYVYLCLSIIPIISEAVPSDPSDLGGGDLVTVINQVRLY